MAATTSGALKAHIESQGLGLAAYRGEAPPDEPLPYVTISEGIATVPDGRSSAYDFPGVRETAQVDLWQDETAEDYFLPAQLHQALHGARLDTAPSKVYGCLVTNVTRLVDPDDGTIQMAYTLEISRNI